MDIELKVEITENQLSKAINYYKTFSHNQEMSIDMIQALECGQIFKAANLHPFYIYDQTANRIIVTSHENMDKKLN